MEKLLKIITGLIFVSVFVTGCSNFQDIIKPKLEKEKPIPVITTAIYSGGFSTYDIRGLWQACSVGFYQIDPNYPREFVHRHCDCYTDHARKNYKNPDDLQSLGQERANILKQNLITECNLKIQQEILNERKMFKSLI